MYRRISACENILLVITFQVDVTVRVLYTTSESAAFYHLIRHLTIPDVDHTVFVECVYRERCESIVNSTVHTPVTM